MQPICIYGIKIVASLSNDLLIINTEIINSICLSQVLRKKSIGGQKCPVQLKLLTDYVTNHNNK